MVSLLEAVFPGRLELAVGVLHRETRHLVELAVNPHLELGHVGVVGLSQSEDLRADVTRRHAVDVVGRDAAQADHVAPDDEAVAFEVELVLAVDEAVLAVTVERIGVGEVLLERQHPGITHGDGHLPVGHLASGAAHHLERLPEAHRIGLFERDVGAAEVERLDFAQRRTPELRDVRIALHHAQHAGDGCRVAVRILPAARGDFHRPGEVAPAVEQADGHVGGVDFGVDVEAQEDTLGAAHVAVPALVHLEPALLPVVGILAVETAHLVDALIEGALVRDGLERHVEHLGRVVAYEGRGVEPRHEGAAVEAVAAVHDVAHARGDVERLGHQPGGHQSDEVGLNLEVEVVGVGVVDPVARGRRHDAVADVVASRLVGVCQMVLGKGEAARQRLGRAVEPLLLEGLDEGQVVVDVVEKSRLLVPPVLDVVLRPGDGLVVLNGRTGELEFGRGAEDDADGLAGPAAANLVVELLLRERDLDGALRCAAGGKREGQCQDGEYAF